VPSRAITNIHSSKFYYTMMIINSAIMPRARATKTAKRKSSRVSDKQLSTRTKKQIDSLPVHAQHIYKKAHNNAIEQYQDPEKRRGGKGESAEAVAHKVSWAAVKREYRKKGDKWVRKE
jgi:cation transport regulator